MLEKQVALMSPEKSNGVKETFMWDLPPGFNFIDTGRRKEKPEGRIDYSTLRNFSVHYPIARSCIDYLKTKVLKLNWDITTEDPDQDLNKDDPRVKLVKAFFKKPLGRSSGYRQFVESILEDYFVVGAIALERMKTRGGQFLGELKLVDASTIKVYVDDYGRIPEPPQNAYAQVIGGSVVVRLTMDDLIYRVRSPRSNTVYGLSPIESIIIQAESALQGSLYSYRWFSDGNMPEGFLKMPEGWTADQIKKFERYFNSMLAGNFRNNRRIKPIPSGAEFVPVKKPEEVGYERFEQWILQLTCTVFGVPPQDIGFTHQINKSSSETQQEMGQERGMRPVAAFLEDMFTDIIQQDFGFADFKFIYTDVDPVDAKTEAEVEKIRLESGVLSVDEIRQLEGREPIGLNHYIKGGKVVLVEDLVDEEMRSARKEQSLRMNEISKEPGAGNSEDDNQESDDEDEVVEQAQKQDLTLWRKKSLRDIKRGREFSKFQSVALDDWMVDEIFLQLNKCRSKEHVDKVFAPYLNNSMQTVHYLRKINNDLDHIIKTQD
jgi:HK97 family phage portal protein